MTIREFVRTVWAGKYYVLAAVLIVVGGSFVYLDRQETVYEATARVQIVSSESVPGVAGESVVTVDTDPGFVRSEPVATAAAALLAIPEDPRRLAGSVQGFYASDVQIMSITARGPTPEVAAERANAVAQAYVAHLPVVLEGQVAALDERRNALRAQLDALNVTLEARPDDPLATAELNTIVEQYQAISALRNSFESIVTPGQIVSGAATGVPLGLPAVLVLAVAVLAGLIAGVGLAFARRGLDARVRTAPEAASLTSSSVLAELNSVRAADRDFRRSGKLPVSGLSASPFTESIRELRTAVRVSIGDVAHAVVVVTAADPQAPRAFITANLAASFALSGRRTIAVSGDLRRPQLDELLPPPDGWEASAHELRPTRVPNLRLMPVPDNEMDPADYLATAHVRQLIDELREDAAVVVIDAPPVLAAADATILGGYATGVVLVATAGQTDRGVLEEAVERLRINHVPLAGIAFAGVKGNRRMIYASTYASDEAIALAHPRHDETPGEQPAVVESPVDTIERREGAVLRAVARRGDAAAAQAADTRPDAGPQRVADGGNPVGAAPDERVVRLQARWPKVTAEKDAPAAPDEAPSDAVRAAVAGGRRSSRR
jgi:Mrp family chromosome partitioning ATPase/capsular polysaccharide biosynthesis protein